jgi:hypothetical protein
MPGALSVIVGNGIGLTVPVNSAPGGGALPATNGRLERALAAPEPAKDLEPAERE